MDSDLENYLLKNSPFSIEMIKKLIENVDIKIFNKGTILLKEGEKINECYLVLKGCIRSYVLKNDEEKTIEFYTEEQSVSPVNYGKKMPSEIYLECIEDTIVAVGTPEKEAEMYRIFPELLLNNLTLTEEKLNVNNSAYINYKISSAEERYLKVINERPDLIQRIPQYQLASYLGIKPETLSRIRRRISKNFS